jgi:predicted pyridoxine 5'-phosphate oxidase superfamily flavin-nucleotide-binding protein
VIPPEAENIFNGMATIALATSDPDGTPNVTYVSQLWYVDDRHVAISNQFHNKTSRNLDANPKAHIRAVDVTDLSRWALDVDLVRRESEGPVYEDMAAQLEVIASMCGMTDVFTLRSADIYEVKHIEYIPLHPAG